MSLRQALGILLVIVFVALAAVHVYWAAGGRVGKGAVIPAAGGRPLFRPSPAGTVVVAVALLAAAGIIAGAIAGGGTQHRARLFRILTFAISFVFLARAVGDFRYVGFFKAATDTRFGYWDSVLFSPLCLAVAAAALLIAWRSPRPQH